jgi:hypothetical protein
MQHEKPGLSGKGPGFYFHGSNIMYHLQAQLFFVRNAPAEIKSAIWNCLREIGRHRPLNRAEIRLRSAMKPLPWRDAGCDRSTWYRRKKRALTAEMARAA